MWAPPPPEPPSLGWWTVLSRDRWIAGVAADLRDKKQADEQAKRLRRLRRRVERVDELIVLAEGASEARRYRRHLYRHGTSPYESRSVGPDRTLHASRRPNPVGQVRE